VQGRERGRLFNRARIDCQWRSTAYGPGGAWFESGPEPVFAEASAGRSSRFIRVMILPRTLLGKSSIRYVNDADKDKPPSQSYKIFVDAPIDQHGRAVTNLQIDHEGKNSVSATKLYYAPGACSLAAHIALEEVGAKFELSRVDLAAGQQNSAEYLRINRKARVPALVEGDWVLTEAPAILRYITARHPSAGLWPWDPREEARCAEGLNGSPRRSTSPSRICTALRVTRRTRTPSKTSLPPRPPVRRAFAREGLPLPS
jgi:hypothetical protein